VGKPEGKRPLGRPRRRWLDNIRMDLQEVGCGYMDWIGLGQDRDRGRTLVSAVMNLRVPWNAGNFLTSCKPVSCSRRSLRHGVSNMRLFFCALPVAREWRDCVVTIKYSVICKQTFFCSFFLSSDSSASEFYVPTFRNTLLRLHRSLFTRHMKMDQTQRPMKMEQTDCSETSVHKY